ncbi:MAG: hypothetical protein S4CHLAM7_11470 [Chlamydiae bacterium]|nr:hypothetical protein [Chlamydiota bacterium]
MLNKITTFLDKLIRFFQVKIFPSIVKTVLRCLLWTNKIELIGLDTYYSSVNQHPSIVMLWHNRVVLTPNYFGEFLKRTSNYTAYVSGSRDGEWLALATESYKNGFTIRVPKRNKHESLRAFIKTLKKSVLVITPDGPRGPKYKIKPGVILAASMTKAQIFPFSWSASKFWKFKSWDGLRIPKPFGKMVMGFGKPFFISDIQAENSDARVKGAEDYLSAFTRELDEKLQKSLEPKKNSPKAKAT